jgi:hypothetical protein
MTLRIITATRQPIENFYTHTALGRSLMQYRGPAPQKRIFYENAQGLPKVYNIAIKESIDDPALLVFIHDDVEITDFFWADHLEQGLDIFDVIGLAGNTHRAPHQQAWAFHDETYQRCATLSGTIGHDGEFGRYQNRFGPSFQEVKLLDGVMLACWSTRFTDNEIWFDERFDFHFYDLDICRQFEEHGLTMGTWGISMVHSSPGRYLSPEWKAEREKYFEKWKE